MFTSPSRRQFLNQAAAAGAVASVGDFGFLRNLPALSAQQVQNPPRNIVQLNPDIEPLVRLIEDTDRGRLMEVVADRVRGGTSYQELLAALMLAGVRGIQPRPVGFKFHAVLVVNSAHLAAQTARDQDRWLPLFWALDNFKNSQARNRQEGDWRMPPVDEANVPAAHQAAERFRAAMDSWDTAAADTAVAGLARSAGANEVYELFFRYGARDFRDIGHKAIFVANSYRTLQTIGWRHAEPILRSLAYALLEHEGTNPAQRDAEADVPGRENVQRAGRIRQGWQRGRLSREAALDLVNTLRTATPAEGSERVVRLLNDQVDPASVWDGLFLMAGEWLMRQPGIVGLHTLTTMNALHFAYQTCVSDETRRYLMLQAAAFLPLFRNAMQRRGQVAATPRIDTLEAGEIPAQTPAAVEAIFADVSRDRAAAARRTLALLQRDQANAQPLMATARRLIFAKGNDSHDYKFSSAVLEDFFHTTGPWRNHFLAASVYWLKGSGSPDTGLYNRVRAALG